MIKTSTIFGICKSYRSCKSEDARVTVLVNRKLQEFLSTGSESFTVLHVNKWMPILAKEKKTDVSVLRCISP